MVRMVVGVSALVVGAVVLSVLSGLDVPGRAVVRRLSEQQESAVAQVSTYDELKTAVANDAVSTIQLLGDLDFSQENRGALTIPQSRSVTIQSLVGAKLHGGSTSRFFTVEGRLVLQHLGLHRGMADQGGAVKVLAAGHLEVVECHFFGNRAGSKSTATKEETSVAYGEGGAIYSEGHIDVFRSEFVANDGVGAAIYSGRSASPRAVADARVVDSWFGSNRSPTGNGGALMNFARAQVIRCFFDMNYAELGGGAVLSENALAPLEDATLNISGSLFLRNSAGYGDLAEDLVVRSGTVHGDESCSQCTDSRAAGGFPSGFCEPLNCDGTICRGHLVHCGRGQNVRPPIRHQRGRKSLRDNSPLIWW